MKVVGGVSPAVANLTVSGDGKWLYFTDLDDKQVGTAEALPKPSPAVAFWVCRAPADLAGPVEGVWVEGNPRWSSALGLSADGKALHALQTGGRSVYPTGTLPSVKVIDTETWRTRETVPLPALKLNWQTPPHGAFHPDGRLFWSRGPAEVTEVTARAALRTRPTSAAPEAYLRVSADGRYLFIADAGTKWNRLVVLDARADAADLGELAVLEAGPGVPVGGPFAVSSDGKYVVFRSGLVVRLDEGEDARKPLPKRDPALESKK
jgi:hypothetical protein